MSEGFDINTIELESVTLSTKIDSNLNERAYAERNPSGIGDHNNDSISDLVIKFNRRDVRRFSKLEM